MSVDQELLARFPPGVVVSPVGGDDLIGTLVLFERGEDLVGPKQPGQGSAITAPLEAGMAGDSMNENHSEPIRLGYGRIAHSHPHSAARFALPLRMPRRGRTARSEACRIEIEASDIYIDRFRIEPRRPENQKRRFGTAAFGDVGRLEDRYPRIGERRFRRAQVRRRRCP